MSDGFMSAKLSNRMNGEARVVLCILAKYWPQLAKSGHVAVTVPQAWGFLGAFFALPLYFDTNRPPRYHPVSSSVLFPLRWILKMCINRLRADQLDILFKPASAPLPALLRDVKIEANNQRAISNAIEKYENNKWSPIYFEGGETDDLQAHHGGEENA